MDSTIFYILFAIGALLFLWPMLFGNRDPIPETSGNVHKIADAAEFDALVSSTARVVVDFYADWCPPCRAIAPIFSSLADQHASKGQLAFAKVNVDHTKDIASRFNVSAMPTFLFFQDGVPQGPAVEGLKGRQTVSFTENGSVDRVRGADKVALETVVRALAKE